MNALKSPQPDLSIRFSGQTHGDKAAETIIHAIGIILARACRSESLTAAELVSLALATWPFLSTIPLSSPTPQTSQLVDELRHMTSTDLIFHLSGWYEHTLSKRAVENEGSFYTPLPLARMMVTRALSRFSDNPPSIADLSVGGGVLLAEVFNQLRNQKHIGTGEILASLYAVDINPEALSFSQILIQLSALLHGTTLEDSSRTTIRQMACGDALVCPNELKRLSVADVPKNAFSFEHEFRGVFEKSGGFDLIIGNPPYGLSREARLNDSYTTLLKRLYQGKSRGRINTYLLFIVRAYQLLAPGGYLSLVVPNAWLGIDEALPIREMLLRDGALCEIDTFSRPPFGALGVEVICFTARKHGREERVTINTFASAESSNAHLVTTVDNPQIMRDPSLRISIKSSQSDHALLRKIESQSIPLSDAPGGFTASIALQVYATGRGEPKQTKEIVRTHPFHVDTPIDESCIAYLEGRNVSPFRIATQSSYLRYGEWMAEFHPRERYTTPRVLVREILGQYPRLITACYTDLPYAYNRSILHVHAPNDHDGEMLRALTVLLNSPLASYWLFHRGRKSQRTKFPKILARDLNEFPIPRTIVDPDVRQSFADAYERQHAHAESDTSELVSRIYGLHTGDWQQILKGDRLG